MTHRPRNRAAVAALLLFCLAGCSEPADGGYLPNHTDWARAQAIWTDPWLAPAETTTPGAGGTPQSGAMRIAGGDSALLAGSLETVRDTEIAAAQRAGWRLVGVDCGLSWESFELVFERGEEGTTRPGSNSATRRCTPATRLPPVRSSGRGVSSLRCRTTWRRLGRKSRRSPTSPLATRYPSCLRDTWSRPTSRCRCRRGTAAPRKRPPRLWRTRPTRGRSWPGLA